MTTFDQIHQLNKTDGRYKTPGVPGTAWVPIPQQQLPSYGHPQFPGGLQPGSGSLFGDPRLVQQLASAIAAAVQQIIPSQPGVGQLQLPEKGLVQVPAPAFSAFKGRRTIDLGPQAVESFPTWIFTGVTNVFMENLGSVATDVTLQAGAAMPEPIRLTPAGTDGSVDHVGRQWAGLTVWIQNASRDPNSLVRVTVW